MRVSTSGRVSNLIGATFSVLALTGSGFARGTFAAGVAATVFAIAGFATWGLGAGLLGFTGTFDVAGDGFTFAGGRATFLGAAAL